MNKPLTPSLALACGTAWALALAWPAHALDTSGAASVAAYDKDPHHQQIRADHPVPGTLTLLKPSANSGREQALADGQALQMKFKGQEGKPVDCKVLLPKAGQKVQPGETAVVSIACSTRWQLENDGLSFEGFEGGRKVAEGTLRP